MTPETEHGDEVYQRWRTYELQKQADAGNMARRFDVLDKLKARYAQSLGCGGGATVDVLSRAAAEEIEWLRGQVFAAAAIRYGKEIEAIDKLCADNGKPVCFSSLIHVAQTKEKDE